MEYDISDLIDRFSDDARTDCDSIGLGGISMGAFTTFLASTLEHRIRAAAPIIGSPDLLFSRDLHEKADQDAIKKVKELNNGVEI